MAYPERLFHLLLLSYPRDFRREFGPEMVQVFRDCYRAAARNHGPLGVFRLLLHTIIDLLRTAPREHLENLGKDNPLMNNLRKDVLGILGCIGIIFAALLLLSYGRKHEISSILLFGRSLDALATAGIVGNLIVFVLVKAARLNQLRTAIWTLAVVNGALLIIAALVGSRVDPQFALGGLVAGYVVSFLFWCSLHWIWSKSSGGLAREGGQ
jgi:hypothetical protein